MGETEQSQLLGQGISRSELDEILRLAHEREWPARMRTLDGRIETKAQWTRYRVFHVATIGSHDLVYVPVAQNQDMVSAVRPVQDFYMVFGRGGVRVE